MIYRKEIDGLRALAVIPVILFHAGFEWISGGYIGVDIFFVISGYLITTILLQEQQQENFSIVNFYERRARRILPALFIVLLVCLPFAWFWLLPHELKDFAKSLIAVVTFVSNILFWLETDYFTADAELIPLLHTWSLAVEEQFYIIFPLFLALFAGKHKRIMVIMVMFTVLLSLGLTEWGWRYFAEGNFYLIPFRAWELMIGVLTAFYLFYKPQPKGLICHLGSLLGLVLILLAIFLLDKSIPFPSLYALAPTLGTALIILFANQQTLVNKILSFKGFVMIGLVSYSAYLWHQPLFVFARAYYMEMPAPSIMLVLSFVSILMGYISWRYIEAPFRNKQRFSQKQVFSGSLLGAIFFILIGIVLIASDGAMYRFT